MKKWLIFTTFLFLFLGACANQAGEEPAIEDEKEKTTQNEEKAEEEPVEQSEEKPEKPEEPARPVEKEPEEPAEEQEEPTDEEEESNQPNVDSTMSMITYLSEMGQLMTEISNYMFDFSDLNTEVSNDPNLIYDDAWLAEMDRILSDMASVIDKVRNMDVPPEAEEIHHLILLAMDEFEFVIVTYPQAIENEDYELLLECADALFRGAEYLTEATNLIADLGF